MSFRKLFDSQRYYPASFLFSAFLCFLSAVVLSLAFMSSQFWFCAWIGLIPLFFALEKKSLSKTFLLAYFTGVIFYVLTIYWIAYVTILGLILLVLYLAIYFGVFGVCVSVFSKDSSFLRSSFLISSSWIVLEFLRSRLLTGFGWVSLGYSQYKNLAIIQIADFGGVFAVSFLIILGNLLIKQVIKGVRNRQIYFRKIIIPFLCIIFSVGYGLIKLGQTTEAGKLRVSVIQGNIPQEIKWSADSKLAILDKYIDLSREASLDSPDIIIWPEASFPGSLDDNRLFNKVLSLATRLKTHLLVGIVSCEKEVFYNSTILVSNKGKKLKRYDKLHLVPFGEFIPLKNLFPFLSSIVPIGDFTSGRDYTIFSLGKNNKKLKFSTLICFEDVFPELSRAFVKKGAGFLINMTNDAWFKQSSAPYQHLQASVFRAVENRKFLIRAANTGVSCFINSYGEIISKVSNRRGKDIFISGYKTEDVEINNIETLYTKFGDIFVLCCFLFLFLELTNKRFFGRR